MEWRVITQVCGIDACTPHNEHVNDVGAALTTCPVQQAEAVIIPDKQTEEIQFNNALSIPQEAVPL